MNNTNKFSNLFVFFSFLVIISSNYLNAHPGGHGDEQNYYPVWTLAPELSEVSFKSTKNSSVTEEHRFDRVSGSLLSNNQFVLTLDLSSVNTAIDIRNQRINEHVFKVEQYKKAMVIGQFDLFDIPMKGQSIEVRLEANLYFQSLRLPIQAEVTIKNEGEQLVVSSTKPIVLSADSLQIREGVDTLKGLAKLKSISPEFPVSFSLTLKR